MLVKLIKSDDWEELQINGDTILANHRLNADEVIKALSERLYFTYDYEYIEEDVD
jgi:hypothetical protein